MDRPIPIIWRGDRDPIRARFDTFEFLLQFSLCLVLARHVDNSEEMLPLSIPVGPKSNAMVKFFTYGEAMVKEVQSSTLIMIFLQAQRWANRPVNHPR
jgi:hypothetical protein